MFEKVSHILLLLYTSRRSVKILVEKCAIYTQLINCSLVASLPPGDAGRYISPLIGSALNHNDGSQPVATEVGKLRTRLRDSTTIGASQHIFKLRMRPTRLVSHSLEAIPDSRGGEGGKRATT